METVSPVIKTIKAEMKRQEMSVQDLAHRSHTSFQNLYQIFRGDYAPNFALVEAMAKVLKLKIGVTTK